MGRRSATNRILLTFGDGLKRTQVCSPCTPRWRGHALPSHVCRLHVHHVGPDGTVTAWRRPLSCPATPLTARAATRLWRPCGPVSALVGWRPGPAPRGGPAESAG